SAAALSSASSCTADFSIKRAFERLHAYPAIGVKEGLVRALTQGEIGVHHRLDGIHHAFRGETATGDLTNGRMLVRRTAKRDLIEFLTLLLDAQNADMADMMMAAGIDAARNLDLQIA